MPKSSWKILGVHFMKTERGERRNARTLGCLLERTELVQNLKNKTLCRGERLIGGLISRKGGGMALAHGPTEHRLEMKNGGLIKKPRKGREGKKLHQMFLEPLIRAKREIIGKKLESSTAARSRKNVSER